MMMSLEALLFLPAAKVVEPCSVSLLGSPLDNTESISAAIQGKIDAFLRMGDRFQYLSAHGCSRSAP